MAWRWCGVRRVFLCMFMFQYSPGNTVNNATDFYTLSQLQSVFDGVQMALRGELMDHGTQASLLQVRSTEQQRILRSSRSDINAVLAAAQGIKLPSHNLLHPARDIQPRPAKTPSVSPDPNYNPDDYWWNQY